MKRAALILVLVAFSIAGFVETATAQAPELLIRTDDVGMSHTVNVGVRKLVETGIPFSASVMIACPWYSRRPRF